jgi:hypothetical protein
MERAVARTGFSKSKFKMQKEKESVARENGFPGPFSFCRFPVEQGREQFSGELTPDQAATSDQPLQPTNADPGEGCASVALQVPPSEAVWISVTATVPPLTPAKSVWSSPPSTPLTHSALNSEGGGLEGGEGQTDLAASRPAAANAPESPPPIPTTPPLASALTPSAAAALQENQPTMSAASPGSNPAGANPPPAGAAEVAVSTAPNLPGPDSCVEGKVAILESASSDPAPSLSEPPGKSTGISAAKQPALMKTGDQAKQFSDPAEQKLPTESAGTVAPALPASPARSAKPVEAPSRSELVTAPDNASVTRPDTTTSSTTSPNLSPISLARSLERTQEMLTVNALRLRNSDEESWRVVIRPGAGLELALDVRQQADGIAVRAALQQGDFDFLSRHWPDLQQQLEARGIRLSPLTSEPSASGGDASASQQRGSPAQAEEASPGSSGRGLTLEGVVAIANAGAPPVKTNGWETWA